MASSNMAAETAVSYAGQGGSGGSGGAELLVALCAVLLVAMAARWGLMSRRKEDSGVAGDIPGSFGLPIVGDTLQFLRALRGNRAWEFVDERLRRAAGCGHKASGADLSVFKTKLFGVATAVMASASGNKLAFANPHSSWPSGAVAVVGRHSIFAYEGAAAAKRLRQALASLLTSPDALRRYSPLINSTIRSSFIFKSATAVAPYICIFPLLKSLAFSIACRVVLGRSRAADHRLIHPPFVSVMHGVFHLPINLPGTPYYRAIRASHAIRGVIRAWIAETRTFAVSDPGDDVLSRFLHYRDDCGEPFSDDEIVDNILVLLIAGHDTTTAAAAMTCKYLALNPAAMEAVYRESEEIRAAAALEEVGWEEVQKMKVTWRAVQESMRLQPPLHGSFRKVVEDTPFDGLTIPKSWKIYWTTATHRNPTYFPNPNKFDLSRFEGAGPMPFTFVPFGGGPRMCPGHEFARMEVLLIIHHLITHFSWTLKDPNEPISMDPVTFPVNGLPVFLKPRL